MKQTRANALKIISLVLRELQNTMSFFFFVFYEDINKPLNIKEQ